MVQILPPKTNVGTQIGQSLGRGIEAGANIGFQRGLLQNALGKVKNISPNSSSIDALTALMEAGAGIPGSERYIGALAPILLGTLRVNQLNQDQNQEGTRAIAPGEGNLHPFTDNPLEASRIAERFVSGNEPSGLLSLPMNPQQMENFASEYSRVMNDPNAYQIGYDRAKEINLGRMQSRQILENQALGQGITPDEMPRFMQLATKHQASNDIPSIVRKTTNEMMEIRNLKGSLRNANIPGVFQKLGGLTPKQFIPGYSIYQALTEKGKKREQALKGYENAVQKLVELGEEPYVRRILAQGTKEEPGLGLSPTEIETLIHPLNQSSQSALNKIPPSGKSPQKNLDTLVNFLKKNVNDDTSLLVLREALMDQKKYTWEQILQAISTAFPKGQNLNNYQNSELFSIAQPPIQSLSQLFSPTPIYRGFLKGQK